MDDNFYSPHSLGVESDGRSQWAIRRPAVLGAYFPGIPGQLTSCCDKGRAMPVDRKRPGRRCSVQGSTATVHPPEVVREPY